MNANLKLGTYYGTEIQVHWTFFLLVVWIVLSEVLTGASVDRVLFNLQFILAVMICVLLHELGHLFAAKRFGIKTNKMVLLPIGGISTVEKITKSPKKEFLITIAGPLVNFSIAIILFFAIPVRDYISFDLGQYFLALNDFSVRTFLFFLFIVNLALAVFNMNLLAGNYELNAEAEGYSQVLWLDAKEHSYIEEVGAMNVFFKINGEIFSCSFQKFFVK